MLPYVIAIGTNVIAIITLVFGIYYQRHFRRDLALAYIALNMGIMAVTMLLSGSDAGLGLGLGLFGILSIVRLRSDTLTQEEVAYYFVALALGLINGLRPDPAWLASALSAGLLVVMALADHPRIARRSYRQTITLDRAYANPRELEGALAHLLGAKVQRAIVLELDVVRDITVVDVRYKLNEVTAHCSQCAQEATTPVTPQEVCDAGHTVESPELAFAGTSQYPVPEISSMKNN